ELAEHHRPLCATLTHSTPLCNPLGTLLAQPPRQGTVPRYELRLLKRELAGERAATGQRGRAAARSEGKRSVTLEAPRERICEAGGERVARPVGVHLRSGQRRGSKGSAWLGDAARGPRRPDEKLRWR